MILPINIYVELLGSYLNNYAIILNKDLYRMVGGTHIPANEYDINVISFSARKLSNKQDIKEIQCNTDITIVKYALICKLKKL